MAYLLVNAEFPGVSAAQRDEIQECLRQNKWIPAPGNQQMISLWFAPFNDMLGEEEAIRNAIREFVFCAKPYCTPKLVIHWGPNRPTFYMNTEEQKYPPGKSRIRRL